MKGYIQVHIDLTFTTEAEGANTQVSLSSSFAIPTFVIKYNLI